MVTEMLKQRRDFEAIWKSVFFEKHIENISKLLVHQYRHFNAIMVRGCLSGIESYDPLNHLTNDRYISLKLVQENEGGTQLVVAVH